MEFWVHCPRESLSKQAVRRHHVLTPVFVQQSLPSGCRGVRHLVVCLCRCAVLNGAFLGLVVYSLFYIGLEPFAGFTWCLFTGIPCWLSATAFSQHVPYAWAYATGVNALSWWAQIHVGHIMLEHRKPALLDSFFKVLSSHSYCQCYAGICCSHCFFALSIALYGMVFWLPDKRHGGEHLNN